MVAIGVAQPPPCLRVERITREHRALFADFDCGEPELNEYLRRLALQNDEKHGIANTWPARGS